MEGTGTLTITLSSSKILSVIKNHAYFIGEKYKVNESTSEIGAKIQAGNDENDTLNDLIAKCTARIASILNKCLCKVTTSTSGNNIVFTGHPTLNFYDAGLVNVLYNYYSEFVTREWLLLVKPDEASAIGDKITPIENDIIRLSANRAKPTRS